MKTDYNIKGKRILFLAPAFFGYEIKIKSKMEQMGAIVDFYDERSITKSFDKALLKIAPKVFNRKTKTYYTNIINENKSKQYDYVFIIKCDMINEQILRELRASFKGAIFCLYLWDSVENIKGVTKKFTYFDKVFSFDRLDITKYPVIKFRPLFYIDDFKKEYKTDNKYKYDVSFCGTIHSDRYKVIKALKEISDKNHYKYFFYCYLQSKFIYYFYKLIKREFRSSKMDDFEFTKILSSKIAEVIDKSKIVLDVQHPKQTGLTMRTIEMIGMHKKLITTNQSIKKYDFYNTDNIFVIDRNAVTIPEGFLDKPYSKIEDDIYNNYSLENWIFDVLGV